MRYSMEDIFEQAKSFFNSVDVSYREEEAYIYKGVRVSKIDDVYRVCNASTGGDNYNDVSPDVLERMKDQGFIPGVALQGYNRYTKMINQLKEEYRNEANTRNNSKTLKSLKNRRKELLNRYSYLKQMIQ